MVRKAAKSYYLNKILFIRFSHLITTHEVTPQMLGSCRGVIDGASLLMVFPGGNSLHILMEGVTPLSEIMELPKDGSRPCQSYFCSIEGSSHNTFMCVLLYCLSRSC